MSKPLPKRSPLARRSSGPSAFSFGQTASPSSLSSAGKPKTMSKTLLRHDGSVSDGSRDPSFHFGNPKSK